MLQEKTENYNEMERILIEQYDSMFPNGYNLMPGGEEPPRLYGETHPFSTISDETVLGIAEALKNTRDSLSSIARQFGVSKKTVLRINNGKQRTISGADYPLRKEANINGKLTEEQVDEIINLLKTTYLFSGEIAKQYGVIEHVVSRINDGTSHHRDNIEYPIRKWKSCGVRNFTYEQVTEIIYRLKNDPISIHKMAKEYGVNPNTIYCINSGTSKKYRRDGETYPIRPF